MKASEVATREPSGAVAAQTEVNTAAKLNIECEPASELKFVGDFRTACVVDLTVRNHSKTSLLFKLKTTTPHKYVVRPHKGEVAANSSLVISITLLPFHFRSEMVCRDKFLLQMCAKSKLNQEYSKHDFWSMVPREELFENKLKCTYAYSPGVDDGGSSLESSDIEPDSQQADDISSMASFKEERQNLLEKLALAKKEIENLVDKRSEMTRVNLELRRELSRSHTTLGQDSLELMNPQVSSGAFVPWLFCLISLLLGIMMGRYGLP